MFNRIRRFLNRLFNKTRIINNEPVNKVSLVVIILIDIFILINVFIGLDDISSWYISPAQAYPCYSEWSNYRTETNRDKDYNIIRNSLPEETSNQPSFKQTYQQGAEDHLGNLSNVCLKYAESKDKINNSLNQQIVKSIDQKQAEITSIEQANRNLRDQYDSTLLEKIAGQTREQSINTVAAEKAKQELEQNNRRITTFKTEISNLKQELRKKPETVSFITFLKNGGQFVEVEKGYKHLSFWYPTIQLFFQALFLIPLILVGLAVHNFAQRKGYGLLSLMSWHLLVIFFIPLIIKIFEFLRVDAIFQFLFNIISFLFGGLLFLLSYVYIFLIPLVGFGIIKLFQKVIFNPKLQAASRVQRSCCINCARKIQHDDSHCPHCGYYQYAECPNCHNPTYKNLPYCKQCGYSQATTNL